jgi:phenylpropionate dioxygenase-like ring-hydroxylating dioxygenase large terminal subunit
MTASPLTDVAQRLLSHVDHDSGDQAAAVMRVPVTAYSDPEAYQGELQEIFLKVPLVVCLSADLRDNGDYFAIEIAHRSIVCVRGKDGAARTFVNACMHRGAKVACDGFGSERRLACPYHAWVYDTDGSLVGVPQRDQFGEIDVTGLIELPTEERSGLIFTILTPGAMMDLDAWLGDMADALAMLQLDKVHRFENTTTLASGNWKSTADGYVDGYHVSYLHSANIGQRTMSGRNTYDLYGPHVRIGFANKPITTMRDTPPAEWDLVEAMSLVHYIFPNISISGQPTRSTMMSRIVPGPTVGESIVIQYHYAREPIDSEAKRTEMETRRKLYAAVTGDEDFATVIGINETAPALQAAGVDFLFGRNEPANQNFHTWVNKLTS